MAVKVQYNAVAHAGGHEGAPWGPSIPYVQIDRQPLFYGGKWGQVMNITLNGTLFQAVEAYPKTLEALEDRRDDIIECFGKQLKVFQFEDDSAGAFGHAGNNKMVFPNTVVESIEFPESGYHALLEFVIRLKCYEQDYFLAQGVVDPVDEFQLQEGEDGSVQVSHNISARGVDFTIGPDVKNGFQNAVEWVNDRLGDSDISNEGMVTAWNRGAACPVIGSASPSPAVEPLHLVLLSQNEKINRLEGTYAITETFVAYLDEDNAVAGLKAVSKYSVDITQSLQEDFTSVGITGVIRGGKDTTLQELRDAVIRNDNALGAAAAPPTGKDGLWEKAKKASGLTNLHKIPMAYSLEEDVEEKTINIKAKFDTNPLFLDDTGKESRYFFDYEIGVDTDEITQMSKISIKGSLQVRGLLSERKCYIQEFIETTNIMDFLSGKAKKEYEAIMKVCHKCSGTDPDTGAAINYYAKAQPGETGGDACLRWAPYFGTVKGDPAELCWELHPCAGTLSVTRNESDGKLEMSATFSDADFLMIDDADASKGCYDKVSFDVSVKNPIDFVKANASGQRENPENTYNGHWAIQKFGIKSRAKSTTKVNLTMRQDVDLLPLEMEKELRKKADEIQAVLNTALLQEGEAVDYGGNTYDAKDGTADGPYTLSKNISYKKTAAESISVSLEKSYIPEPDADFCVELPEPASQKSCFDCVDSGGVKKGGEVYAYQDDPDATPDEAFQLCDAEAVKVGLNLPSCGATTTTPVPTPRVGRAEFATGATTTTTSPADAPHCLFPTPCKDCYTCYEGEVEQGDVQAVDSAAAAEACLTEHGCDVDASGNDQCLVFPCSDIVEFKCYTCEADDGAGGTTTETPPGEFNASTLASAQTTCDNDAAGSTATECPSESPVCWTCAFGSGFTNVYTVSQPEAELECEEIALLYGLHEYVVAACGTTPQLKCWECGEGGPGIVYAYNEAAAIEKCGDAGLESSTPIACPD